jgi:hypothetical protein
LIDDYLADIKRIQANLPSLTPEQVKKQQDQTEEQEREWNKLREECCKMVPPEEVAEYRFLKRTFQEIASMNHCPWKAIAQRIRTSPSLASFIPRVNNLAWHYEVVLHFT